MGVTILEGGKVDNLIATLEVHNHLISHQNAAIDLLASDKRSALIHNVETVAQMCADDEILEVMDYGDFIDPAWSQGETQYNPALNLCHITDGELEDGEIVHGAYFEWDKTTPIGIAFDAPEAIYYFDGTEGAGDKYITISVNYGSGWIAGESIQITLDEAPAENDQLYINCGTNYANNPTANKDWSVYGKGETVAKQSGKTSNGTAGTKLGETHATDVYKTNGRVNAPARVVYGYNRWSQSALRQYLNSELLADAWWKPLNSWDRPVAQTTTVDGFLSGYAEDVRVHFKPIKHITVACNADDNVEDITYDQVFLASLEQMYCVPQFAGKEGEYWEYYKRLLGRTSPAPTGYTYARLIKYALNAPTSAQDCFRRSAYRNYASGVWCSGTSGRVSAPYASSAYRCAPSVFISK